MQQTDVIPTDVDCASITAWVAEKRDDLPASYEELARFPVAYRRAIFDALPPAAKSSLWQQHFQAYRAAHPGLTPEQKAFIQKARSLISPGLFVNHASMAESTEVDTRVSTLRSEAAMAFPESELYGLLANLGPADPADHRANNTTESVACECNKKDDWCWNRFGNHRCRKGGCDRQSFGCGTFLRKSCNGLCVRR